MIGMTDKELYEAYMRGHKGSWCHGYIRKIAETYAKEHGLPFDPTL